MTKREIICSICNSAIELFHITWITLTESKNKLKHEQTEEKIQIRKRKMGKTHGKAVHINYIKWPLNIKRFFELFITNDVEI